MPTNRSANRTIKNRSDKGDDGMYWDVMEESWNQLKEHVREQWDGLDSNIDDAAGDRDPMPAGSTESAARIRM